MKHKKCTICGVDKKISEYSERPNVNESGVVYFKSQCKKCTVGLTKWWREKNLDAYNEYQRKYRKANYQSAKIKTKKI